MASHYTAGRFKAFDDAGLPLPNARLYTYVNGTTTQQNAFTTAALTTPCTYTSDGLGGQYIATDARGEANLWLGLNPYTLLLKTQLGATIWQDNDQNLYQNYLSQGAPASIASAATVDIGGALSTCIEVTGTGTITSLGTNYNGPRFVRFAGVNTLTHNATTLNLPGSVNIITAAGDWAIFEPNVALNGWNCVYFSGISALKYRSPVSNAVLESLQSKLDTGMMTAQTFGGIADNATNAAPALNIVFNQGLAGYSIPAGSYKFTSAIIQDNSGGIAVPGAASVRNAVSGASMANTFLNYSSTGYAIRLTGCPSGGANQGIYGLDIYSNFTLQDYALAKNNSGIIIQNKEWFSLNNIYVQYMDVALNLTSCYSAEVNKFIANLCNVGCTLQTTALGASNSVTFNGFTAQSCTAQGVLGLAVGYNITFDGARIEACGTQANYATGGIIANMGAYGFAGNLTITDSYFEGNAGVADISVDNPTVFPMTITIKGNTFQRTLLNSYTLYNINVTSSGGGFVTVILEGNTFVTAGTYVPSGARPYWLGTSGKVRFIDNGGNNWNETTSLPLTLDSGRAAVNCNIQGSTGGALFAHGCTTVRNSVGNYTVTLSNPIAGANYAPLIVADKGGNGAVGYQITAQTTSAFTFVTTTQATTLFDPTTIFVAVFT